jgi:phosphoserine phosphatase
VDFVERVTTTGSPTYVAPAERVAVFDNDGTLWCEQPIYTQVAFALDRVKALAPEHPEWQRTEPFRSLLAGDLRAAASGGEKGAAALIAATHAGMTTDEFTATVRTWIARARHPKLGRPYDSCVYQPMLELLAYLRDNGFSTFIVSGGGADFVRAISERRYGIPPERVIGSTGKVVLQMRDGTPVLVKQPAVEFVDDGQGKPVGIHRAIGRRPVMAFGNSDGDLQMLQWTAAGDGPRFCLLVHHTDAEREFAYDRASHFGKLDAALDEATRRGWTVADMERDWARVFPEA